MKNSTRSYESLVSRAMESEEDLTCKMGHCRKIREEPRKDICGVCYAKFGGELGQHMSEVVRLMIKRAIERGRYEVLIEKDHIYEVWPRDNKCPIMGTTFTIGGDLDTSPSLDRIDPDKPYECGNIQVISNIANTMKNSACEQQLLRFSMYYMSKFYEEYKNGRESV